MSAAMEPLRPVPADPENTNPPVCKRGCKWLQVFSGYDRQRNALRIETASLVQEDRCGWNLLPGRIGGHPLDYAPCTNAALAKVTGGES